MSNETMHEDRTFMLSISQRRDFFFTAKLKSETKFTSLSCLDTQVGHGP
jgi:hypothetical protein